MRAEKAKIVRKNGKGLAIGNKKHNGTDTGFRFQGGFPKPTKTSVKTAQIGQNTPEIARTVSNFVGIDDGKGG